MAAMLPRSNAPVAAFVILAVVLAALDQSRWQPWFLPADRLEPAPPRRRHVPPLLSRPYRTAALLVAAAMDPPSSCLRSAPGPTANTVVWPWNFAMALSAFLLFWRVPDVSLREILWPKGAVSQTSVLVLFTVAPLLSFFNAWDNYLSWALYAGNRNDADVYMTDAVEDRLPEDLLEYVYEEGRDRNRLNLPTSSLGELNVPAYPEPRIYRNVARSLCPYAAKPSDITLVIQGKIALLHRQSRITYTCAALAK